jgi:galactokinase
VTSDEDAFRACFGARPDARINVPGRVNLIGDHIDYCGLPVLPAAIQRRVTLHVRTRTDARIRIRSTSTGEREFGIESPLPPFPPGDWGNYPKAAIAELIGDVAAHRGFDALLESDLPQSAGLSSSSAIVVASALAFLHANRIDIDRTTLATRLARAERFVGTEGGGMDQAILLLAHDRSASLIEFDPLRATPIAVPDQWAFIVAHSLVDARKSAAAREAYNARPREAEAARTAVASHLDAADATYSQLLRAFDEAALLDAAASIADNTLTRRFTHVITEARRVEEAAHAIRNGDAVGFGRLMNESHESLRTNCEVSTPQLDNLAKACIDAGALGARLTGAGFGGCIVALATAETKDEVLENLRGSYYDDMRRTGTELHDVLFPAIPARGASIHQT